MHAALQHRIQRYGWDAAADDYDLLWRSQLASAHRALLDAAALKEDETVIDVACGTGLVSLAAARAVGPRGRVLGIDISQRMVDAARDCAAAHGLAQARFERREAEHLEMPDGSVDAVLCALGLMYLPAPEQAMAQMVRVLRPGGRFVAAVWGERARCAWAPVFSIVDDEVASDVCPLFFRLGAGHALAQAMTEAGLQAVEVQRLRVTLEYDDAQQACDAAFIGGPVALAWTRFDEVQRRRARARYLDAIAAWRTSAGAYRLPAEFVIAKGVRFATA